MQKNSNNIHSYSTLKEGEQSFPLPKCGLHVASSFQMYTMEGLERITLQWSNLTNTTSDR
jgi:hypothetical protein